MVHLRPPWLGPPRRDGEDGCHDEIHRDHVDDAFGHPGELAQEAPGVGDDDRLRHAEAADPSGPGLRQRGLNDGGPHEGDGDLTFPLLDERPLTERFREGVGIGPSERERPGRAGSDQFVAHPLFAHLLGLRRDQVIAGGADLRSSLFGEAAQLLGSPGFGLEVVAQPPR